MTDHEDLIRRLNDKAAGMHFPRDILFEAATAIKALVAERDGWKDTANQHCLNELYYTGLIDGVAPLLGPAMYTQDDGNVVPEPLRACLPKAVNALVAERDEYKGRWEGVSARCQQAEFDLAVSRKHARLCQADKEKVEAERDKIEADAIAFKIGCDEHVAALEADLAAARKALVEAQRDIIRNAFNEGLASNGEFDHCCMSDAEWLVRECGFSGRRVPLDELNQAMLGLAEKLADDAIAAARAEEKADD